MDGTLALGFILAAFTAEDRANEGTFALLFMVASATDMYVNECPVGCLNQTPATKRLNLRAGELLFQDRGIGSEYFAAYDLGTRYGPFQPTIGVSATSEGDYWVGAGAKWTTKEDDGGPFYMEASLMPGYYTFDEGPDIGGWLQFRSSLSLGYEFENGATFAVVYDHRSNSEAQDLNPGLETLGVQFGYAFN